jgi:formylglycine-generating enzyme required for sulfatase activity
VQVAAVWTRDGRGWQLAYGLTAQDVRDQNAKWKGQGYLPADVTGYAVTGQDGPREAYAGVWEKAAAGQKAALYVGLTDEQEKAEMKSLKTAGYHMATYSLSLDSAPAGDQEHDPNEERHAHYAAVWHKDPAREVVEIHDLDPAEHLTRCRQRMAEGFRPVAISLGEMAADKPLVAASVWHRPPVAKQTPRRQANLAVTAMRLGRPDWLWPLLKASPDPITRTYIIHRLALLGAAPKALIRQVDGEADVSIAQALLLSLGEFAEDRLTSETKERMLPRLLRSYRDDPDPGIHAAAEWLLRRWGQAHELNKIDSELATGKIEGDRQWYVNAQKQTLVVIRGPVEFEMGAPAAEEDRSTYETLHRCRIGRTYAMATKEVTVEQYQRFEPNFGHDQMQRCPEPTCPILGVKWYEAVAYCNWLSAQEGLPADQRCYVPNSSGQLAEGLTLAADWLHRTGYRLPTEAEWEYACRAGASTCYCYGQARELLGSYAWYLENSNERSWPVGQLKPNGLGLFDVHGNVGEWCADWYDAKYYGASPVDDPTGPTGGSFRVGRGGGWDRGASDCRASFRFGYDPGFRFDNLGFRLARTVSSPSR